MTARWSLDILVIADDAVPAAERLKNVAPGASPGYPCRETLSPGRGERSACRVFRPSGAEFNANTNPGLAPGATSLRRSAAMSGANASPIGRSHQETWHQNHTSIQQTVR